MHLQNFIKIHQFIHKILSTNEISTSIKGHNSVENERKILFNHPNLHLVNINAYTKFDQIHKLIHKILSINKILTLIKGHNSVKNWPKITCIRDTIWILYISMHIHNLIKIHPFVLQILRKNTFLTQIKGHNSVENKPKIMCIITNIDLVYVNACTKFYQNSSFLWIYWGKTHFYINQRP